MPCGTKYHTSELDSHRALPRVGAAITRPLVRDAAKFSSSQVLFRTSAMQASAGSDDVQTSMPTSNSRLNASQRGGSGTRYQAPLVVTL